MKKTGLMLLLAGAAFLEGCDKQTQTNTEKISVLSQEIIMLQKTQAKQLENVQLQLTALPSQVDKIENAYFLKTHNDVLFYHTNVVFLLVTMDKKIQTQFQTATAEREAENSIAFYYHTNQVDTMFFCVGQLEDALAGQENRLGNTINTETRRVGAAGVEEMTKQIKSSALGQDQAAKLEQMEAELAQLQSSIDLIKARLGITNSSLVRP